MGGFFGAALHEDCLFDIFYGTDYHSHLGTRRAGIAVYGKERGFDRAIHNIESTYFRPKFEKDILKMKGNLGIGVISDYEPQPLIIRSHLGTYAICTVGKINNSDVLIDKLFNKGLAHFFELSGGEINQTELAAALINQRDSLVEGIRYVQDIVQGSMTMLVMTKDGIYASRDKWGRTPVAIGKGEYGYCVSFEDFSYRNLGYVNYRELGPGEVAFITPDGVETVSPARDQMRICTFLWIYYGFPGSSYEGLNVEATRFLCGQKLAQRNAKRANVHPDSIAAVPDSGIGHAIGYSNESGIPYSRPFTKYTPTWPRSFMPAVQSKRDLIAKMKLVPIPEMIEGKRLLIIDDSIVRGTQLRDTIDYLYKHGVKELHMRPACPPLVYGCKYLNFSRTNSEKELISRRMIEKLEGTNRFTPELLEKYTDPESDQYNAMLEEIRKDLNFTTLHYHRLDDMIEAVHLDPCKLCTYCWSGKE